MLTVPTLASCILLAANTYHIPEAVMNGIMHVEGGHVGQEVGPDFNGSYDLGPMQINTGWLPVLEQEWHVDTRTARSWVRDNGCVNVHVAAWILRRKVEDAGSLWGGVAAYHSATPEIGASYAHKVMVMMDRKDEVSKIEVSDVEVNRKEPLFCEGRK